MSFANYNSLTPLFAPASFVLTACYDPEEPEPQSGYCSLSGTSLSTPAAAAAVAILIQAHEQLGLTDWTPATLESLLFDTGETILNLDPEDYRRINLEGAIRSLFPDPVEDPLCFALPHEAYLSWFLEDDYDDIEILRDGESIALLDGGDSSFVDEDALGGFHTYGIVGIVGSAASTPTECTVFIPEELNFAFEGSPPRTTSPIGQSFRVTIEGLGGHELGTEVPSLYYDLGDGFVEVSLTDLGDDRFEGEFPPLICGQRLPWYLSAETTTGSLGFFPAGAPDITQVSVGSDAREVIFDDDMEVGRGWTVGGSRRRRGPRSLGAGGSHRDGRPTRRRPFRTRGPLLLHGQRIRFDEPDLSGRGPRPNHPDLTSLRPGRARRGHHRVLALV